MDLRTYLDQWLEDLSASQSVERSTIRDYRNDLNAWKLDVELSQLTRRDVERAMRQMLSEGRAATTVRKRAVVLRRALDDAVSYGDIPSNPMDGVRFPKVPRRQPNFLPVEERERLKARIAEHNTRLYVAAALALYAGLREGEACGLMTSDIDLERGIGWVRRSIGHATKGTYAKEPKNGRMRDFPIPPQLALAIGRWVDSNSIPHGSYLLTGSDKWMDPIVLGRLWSSLCEVEGFVGVTGKRPTFHDLRHTYATVAITAGVDVKTVSSVLGHSSAAMTLDVYAVADPVAKRMSAEVVGNAI